MKYGSELYETGLKEACEIIGGEYGYKRGNPICYIRIPKEKFIKPSDEVEIVIDKKYDNVYVTHFRDNADIEAIKLKHGRILTDGDNIIIDANHGRVKLSRDLHKFIMIDTKKWYER